MTANAIRFARTRWILLTIMLLLIVPLIAVSIVGLHGPQIERETKANLEIVARGGVQRQQVRLNAVDSISTWPILIAAVKDIQ